ncbi:MAG: hypothetical protein AAGI25_13385 [Bacteroidota bacterium]
MPANKKYLLKTQRGRTSKILAMILGTLLTCVLIHMPLSFLFGNRVAMVVNLLLIFYYLATFDVCSVLDEKALGFLGCT